MAYAKCGGGVSSLNCRFFGSKTVLIRSSLVRDWSLADGDEKEVTFFYSLIMTELALKVCFDQRL